MSERFKLSAGAIKQLSTAHRVAGEPGALCLLAAPLVWLSPARGTGL